MPRPRLRDFLKSSKVVHGITPVGKEPEASDPCAKGHDFDQQVEQTSAGTKVTETCKRPGCKETRTTGPMLA